MNTKLNTVYDVKEVVEGMFAEKKKKYARYLVTPRKEGTEVLREIEGVKSVAVIDNDRILRFIYGGDYEPAKLKRYADMEAAEVLAFTDVQRVSMAAIELTEKTPDFPEHDVTLVYEDVPYRHDRPVPELQFVPFQATKFDVAWTLLQRLQADERVKKFGDVQISLYENGREHGVRLLFQAKNGEKKAISCSEYRNTDSIVVYFGKEVDTSITEEAFRNAAMFTPGHYNRAVNYIFRLLDENCPQLPSTTGFKGNESMNVAMQILNRLENNERFFPPLVSFSPVQDGENSGFAFINHGVNKLKRLTVVRNGADVRFFYDDPVMKGLVPKEEKQFTIDEGDKMEEAVYAHMHRSS